MAPVGEAILGQATSGVSPRHTIPGPWARGAQLDGASRGHGDACNEDNLVEHCAVVGVEAIGREIVMVSDKVNGFDELLFSYHAVGRGGGKQLNVTNLRIILRPGVSGQ